MKEKILTRIRKRQNPFYNRVYLILKGIRKLNVPVISWIHAPLYVIVKGILNTARFLLQKLLWEPLFKVNCHSCGSGLRVLLGMPLLSENLIMKLGKNVTINGRNTFSATSVNDSPVLEIGDNTVISYLVSISVGERVVIGENCLLAERIVIADNNGHPTAPNRRHQKVAPEEIAPITIGNNVWIGSGAFIGGGVVIGDGAVIGANSIVKTDIPPNCIAGGIPARVIRKFTEQEIL